MVLAVHESTDAVARIMAQERALGTEQLKASVDLIREGDFPADAFLLDLLVERSGKQLRSILVDGVALAVAVVAASLHQLLSVEPDLVKRVPH